MAIKTTITDKGQHISYNEMTPEQKAKYDIIALKTETAMAMLHVIFGDNMRYVLAVIPEASRKPSDVLFVTDLECPACAVELVVETAQSMRVRHLTGEGIFEMPKGEKAH